MNTKKDYIPDAGDVVWMQFSPQAGHEQSGHRPAVVLSPAIYNDRAGLLLCCTMTTQIKGYPFEVLIGENKSIAVLADQVKSLDWRIRLAKFKSRVSPAELAEIRRKATILINPLISAEAQ